MFFSGLLWSPSSKHSLLLDVQLYISKAKTSLPVHKLPTNSRWVEPDQPQTVLKQARWIWGESDAIHWEDACVPENMWQSPGGQVVSQVELTRSDPCLPVSSHVIKMHMQSACWMPGLLQSQRANMKLFVWNHPTWSLSWLCYRWCTVVWSQHLVWTQGIKPRELSYISLFIISLPLSACSTGINLLMD